MGFFSWKTSNTNKSISNSHSERGSFPVVMVAPNGERWVEKNYDGYGEFGGKDYYELLAELNGGETRGDGIGIYFDKDAKDIIYPLLLEMNDQLFTVDHTKRPDDCDEQGYFYGW
tara:strand:- start:36 stop:380 length:345 start_codon:yes stop_codon:yes gene_type:complete